MKHDESSQGGHPEPTGVEITEDSDGLAFARLRAAGGAATVSLHGAQLTSYRPRGCAEDVIWMGDYRIRKDADCWGGVPLCWPWFMTGPDPSEPRGPFHGFARKLPWMVRAHYTADDGSATLRLVLGDGEASRKWWPAAFETELSFTVGEALDMVWTTRNTGDAAFDLEHCFHAYFRVGDVTRASLHGIGGSAGEEPLRFDGHFAGQYDDTAASHRIEDPVLKRAIHIEKTGSEQTVVWNSGPVRTEGGRETGEPEWRTQLAVEPLCGKDRRLRLAPGESATLGMRIACEPLG